MLIYIIHNENINTFRLPKEVSGNYMLNDINSDGKSRSLINISSENGKWILNSNKDTYIVFKDQNVPQIELAPYNFYQLNYYDKEKILLYVFPGFDTSFTIKNVKEGATITMGSDPSCDIVCKAGLISGIQFYLTYNNGIWKFKNNDKNIPHYVNRIRREAEYLANFDSVFIMGLKLIVVGNRIIVFSPPNTMEFGTNNFLSEDFQYAVPNDSSTEIVKEFYKSSDYFYKSPIFKKKYDEYHITITPPDEKEKEASTSILSEIIPSAMMSITSVVSLFFTITNSESNSENLITSVIMCCVMLFTGIIWPVIQRGAEKIKAIISAKIRIKNYKNYLARKDKEMADVIEKEKSVLFFNNISLQECQDAILNKNSNLFSRNIQSDSFLTIKCGTGKVKSSIIIDYRKPDMIVLKDDLYNDIDTLIKKYEYIDDAIFTTSLKNSSLAVIDYRKNTTNFMNAIILQLVTLHDYHNLKIVVLTKSGSCLKNIRNLNHCWNNERSFRYYATNLHEGENISSELMKIVTRINEKEKNKVNIETNYVIISDCIENYKSLKIIDYILKNNADNDSLKFMSLLMFSDKVTNIPTGCEYFINYSHDECAFFNSEMDEKKLINFKPSCIDDTIDFYGCIEKLSNIPVKINALEVVSASSLPTKLGFLEMYGVGNISQLNILEKWKSAPISSTLAAPVGVDASGNTLYLDLHEKKHGPHGLIAGMTGSGKSEFIITYILSLAISYSPNEVQFVLIDYKGGGLAGAFENRKTGIKLPHLVGTITNLDKAEMNRTLVSIKSELQRRQKVFNETKEKLNTGSIDIYKYQMLVRDGALKEPMSHLFIICDEFAELKAQQPDFMDELVSAARIGRSLGIHLILATQKPSGVVDDQIWSNAKFKVCCKVQTAEDSKEMLRNPDAAYIKETGRFYLQVGYDEYYVLGQSGYSGVQYIPSEIVSTTTDNSISFIDNNGDIYRNASKKVENENENKENLGEELNNILNYIVEVAKNNNYENHQLWLDNIPKKLYYADVIAKYNNPGSRPYDICPIIGEFDKPDTQSQGCVQLPITGAGNTMILGNSGSGKCSLLFTLIFSTIINHTSEEVNIYILDFGSEKFNIFKSTPHVGDVLTIDDKNKIRYFFYMIEDELNRRQKYYSENGGDFVLDVKNGNPKFSNIMVIIYGMEAFKENFYELYEGLFTSIMRLSSKVGIEFVMTGFSTGAIGLSIDNNIKQKVLLQLTDESDYKYVFKTPIVPASNPGRGIILHNDEPVEFQTALVYDEMKQKEYLDTIFDRLRQVMNYNVKKVPDISKKLSLADYTSNLTSLNNVPLGVNVITAQQEVYDFSKKYVLLSAEINKNTAKFFSKFSSIICSVPNTNLIVLNGEKEFNVKVNTKAKYYDSDFSKIVNLLYDNCERINNEPTEKKFVLLILGYTSINKNLIKMKKEDENVKTLDDLVKNTRNDSFKYLLYEKTDNFENIMNSDISDALDNSNGIWIGKEYDGQQSFEMQDFAYGDNPVNQSNELIVIIRDSDPVIVRYPTIE